MSFKPVKGRVGIVARFKPVTLGHAVLLESLCAQADHLIIGLGSSNVYDCRNPFTAQESAEMIDALLRDRFSNYEIIEVPDLNNPPKWTEMATGLFGKLDYFVTGNDFVKSLLNEQYTVVDSWDAVPTEFHIPICGTMARVAMAQGNGWAMLVPDKVANYIREQKLDERFCREFGLETLASHTLIQEVR